MASKNKTITDIVRATGFSKKTVSRVINGDPAVKQSTRDAIQSSINDLGYVPNSSARSLALGRNFLIALVHDNPNEQTVIKFQQGILGVLRKTSFAMIVDHVDRDSPALEQELSQFLTLHRPAGVIMLPPISERDELAAVCDKLLIPIVRVGSASFDRPERMVFSNDRSAVFDAVSDLISSGHQHIGFVAGPKGFRSAKERKEGFVEALKFAKVELHDEMTVQGDYTFASGEEAGKHFLRLGNIPSAIFASNDEMAAGMLLQFSRNGVSVPGDVAIVGFDNSPTSQHVWPRISTISWPVTEMAELATGKLFAAAGLDFADIVTEEPCGLQPTFLERESSKRS